jgi:hypothetical protein
MRPVTKKLGEFLVPASIGNDIYAEGVLHVFDPVMVGSLIRVFQIKCEVL